MSDIPHRNVVVIIGDKQSQQLALVDNRSMSHVWGKARWILFKLLLYRRAFKAPRGSWSCQNFTTEFTSGKTQWRCYRSMEKCDDIFNCSDIILECFQQTDRRLQLRIATYHACRQSVAN